MHGQQNNVQQKWITDEIAKSHCFGNDVDFKRFESSIKQTAQTFQCDD